MDHPFRFPKSQKLCGSKAIEQLFVSGQGFSRYPLRAIYSFAPLRSGEQVCRVMVSVSKKRFKHAVDRNRVKRLVREAFRLNRAPLNAALQTLPQNMAFRLAFVFVGKDMPDYKAVEHAICQIVDKLSNQITNPIAVEAPQASQAPQNQTSAPTNANIPNV